MSDDQWLPPPPPPSGGPSGGQLPPPPPLPGGAWGPPGGAWGQPDASWGPSLPPSNQPTRIHGMAVTSFVLGLVGWIVAGLGSLVGLILGIQSLRAIDRPGSGLHGRGLAIAGIVLGCLGILFGVLVFATLLGSDVDDIGTNNFDEVLELQVGDCYDEESGFDGDPTQTFTAFVEPRACGEAHDAEVYALVFHPSGPETPYPGEGAVVNFAQRECAARFEDFVGRSYDDSSLDIFYLFPQKAVWTKLDDRRIVCSVYDVRGDKLVGSMRGSRR